MLTLIPILAPSLRPVDLVAEVGEAVGAVASGACFVLEIATARSVGILDVLAARDVATAACDLDEMVLDVFEVDGVARADDDVSEEEEVVIFADVFEARTELLLKLMVVKGLLRSRLFTFGSV